MSQIIVPSRKLWTPPQKQRGYVVLDAYRGGGGGSGGSWPDFSTVSALLHFDGVSGGTTFTDETGKAWTLNAGPTINTTNQKYGSGCVHFNTSNSTAAYLKTPHHADFNFGSGDFTIQFWVDYITAATGYNGCVVAHDQVGGTRGWLFNKNSVANDLRFSANIGGTLHTLVDSSGIVPEGVMTHFAGVRDGNTLRFYRNGVQVASAACSGSIGEPSEPCAIGVIWGMGVPSNTHRFYGYLDDLCISKGVCWYPDGSTFTPPATALYT